MDARKYASKFVKPDNVRDGPIVTRIVSCFEDERYGNLVLELETGSQFTLYSNNASVLIKSYGAETDAWIGMEIELSLDTYRDWKSDADKETVRVRPASPGTNTPSGNGSAPAARPLPPSRTMTGAKTSLADDLSDEVPF